MKPKATPPPKIEQTTANPSTRQGIPQIEEGTKGHDFGVQFAFDVNKQIGKLEVQVQHLEERTAKIEAKVDRLQEDVSSIKTTIATFEPLASKAIFGIWAIFWTLVTGLVGTAVTVFVMWLRHTMGW